MTRSLDPKPAKGSREAEEEARLSELAARYFDLWQENWTVWLASQDDDEPAPPAVPA